MIDSLPVVPAGSSEGKSFPTREEIKKMTSMSFMLMVADIWKK